MRRRRATIAEQRQLDADDLARQQREAEMFRRQGFQLVACQACSAEGPWRPYADANLDGPVCDTCTAELDDMLGSEKADDE